MKILIVDDHPLYIDGLRAMLTTEIPSLDILKAFSVQEALVSLEQEPSIDLLLIDIELPGLGGLDLLQSILNKGVAVPSIVISGDTSARKIKQALDLGACGFIPKSYTVKQFVPAITKVVDGGMYVSENLKRKLLQLEKLEYSQTSLVKVTPRQLDVLRLMRKGYPTKKISSELGLSDETVKEHISNLFNLLGVDNRISCLFKAQEIGLSLV